MDQRVVAFYQSLYQDLALDRDESARLRTFLLQLNAPPDKIIWLRSTAFRVACPFLTGRHDQGVQMVRLLNSMTHAIETELLQPQPPALTAAPVDTDLYTAFYRASFQQWLAGDKSSQSWFPFFQREHPPDSATLTKARFLAFKVACEFVPQDNGDGSSSSNVDQTVDLLRGVNAMVHAFEMACLQPKPFELKLSSSSSAANGGTTTSRPPALDLKSLSLSDAVQYLWKLDDNRLDPHRDYAINVQGGKKPYWKGDQAQEPLFDRVDPAALRRPTYRTFVALLDNYKSHTGQAEYVTHAEEREIDAFLTACLNTKPLQFCHQYCRAHDGNIPSGRAEFQKLLYKIWFELYSREARNDSSGFEHVFVGEVKNGKISGFHNWIHFYLQERAGTVDYKGYIKPRNYNDAAADENDHLLTLQFTWHGVEKSVGSSFIGVSPEFELALYTMCFLVGDQKTSIQLATGSVEDDTFELDIVCYKMAHDKVGTSYPEIRSHWEG